MASDQLEQDETTEDERTNYKVLMERVRARTVVPFLGAGLSADLLPVWSTLIESVAETVLGSNPWRGDNSLDNSIKVEVIRDKLYGEMATETTEDTIVKDDPLANEFAKEFRKKMKTVGLENWFRSFVLGDNPPEELSDVAKKYTFGHRAVCTGPWPIILTTNWDTMLEAGYKMINEDDEKNSDVWGTRHPGSRFFKTDLPVRFRRDTQLVYAELRAGIRPPRLLKLHGDFTENGIKELVAGHSDYRQLMIRDVGFHRLMQHIFSNYHLLFYGCSLGDPDILAILDGMRESLGSETGPHFWITKQKVSEPRRKFLEKHYSVHILLEETYNLQKERLKKICDRGWALPKRLVYKDIGFKVLPKGSIHCTNVRIEHGSLEDAICGMKSDASFSVGIPVSLCEDGFTVRKTPELVNLVCRTNTESSDAEDTVPSKTESAIESFKYEKKAEEKEKEKWRSKRLSENSKCWFLCADSDGNFTTNGGSSNSATLSGVFKAVKHFIKEKYAEPSSEQEQKREHIFLPLLGGGKGGNLNDHEVLRAMLSAIGKFIRSPKLCADITVYLGTYRTDAIMADVDAGRFNPGQLLARAGKRMVEFTCVAPVVSGPCSLAQTDRGEEWRCRKLRMKINANVNDLRKEMGLEPREQDEEKTLLEVGITDGSVVKVNSRDGDITNS